MKIFVSSPNVQQWKSRYCCNMKRIVCLKHQSMKDRYFAHNRTVMKTGSETVKAALWMYFNYAAEDLEKTQENLKLGRFTHNTEQSQGVIQIINYTTFALLPVLSSLFEHIGQNMFGQDLICK